MHGQLFVTGFLLSETLKRRGGHGRCTAKAETQVESEIPQWWRESWPLNADRSRRKHMRVVVIGGTGLIGSRVVAKLRDQGHDAVVASPDTGVNTLTGQGLADVLQGASVVIDVSNSPSFEETKVMDFFTTSTRNLLKYAAMAGVRHYVALSGGRNRADTGQSIPPSEERSGIADQKWRHPILDRSCDTVF
jgi:hypothetical protein